MKKVMITTVVGILFLSVFTVFLPVEICEAQDNSLSIDAPLKVNAGEEFTVTIKSNETPIEYAVVTFNDENKNTDANGQVNFTAPHVCADRGYTITATAGDFPLAEHAIMVRYVPRLSVVVPEEVYSGSTFDICVANDCGDIIADAIVTVEWNSETYTPDAFGIVKLTAPIYGENRTMSYDITAKKSGYVSAETEIEVWGLNQKNLIPPACVSLLFLLIFIVSILITYFILKYQKRKRTRCAILIRFLTLFIPTLVILFIYCFVIVGGVSGEVTFAILAPLILITLVMVTLIPYSVKRFKGF